MSMIDERPAVTPEPGLDRAEPRRPVRGRALWVIFGSLLLVGSFWWGTFSIVELLAHEERTERITVPAASLDRLLVDNDTGSVTIVGTDTDVINVEAEVSDGLRDTGFRHEVVGSTLELRGSCPLVGSMWCRVAYRVEVPREFDVEVDVDDDRVDISNIDGNIVVNSNNGAVDLADIAGEIRVEGDNGRIVGTDLSSTVVAAEADNGHIELAFVVPPDAVTVNGDNGSIDVAVPDVDIGYDVTADTSNGGDDILVTNNPDSPHKIGLETDNGSITVRSVG
jgi:hypothetical protein